MAKKVRMTKEVLIAFGSPSDHEKYFKPDFPHASDTRYWLSVASAHRVPEVVKRHARARPYDAIIAGAGMKNALMDAYFRECPNAIHVALPIGDSRTLGLSSILSSSEMPPGCPVAMSEINNLPAAVDFANYAINTNFDSIRLQKDSHDDSEKVFGDAVKMLSELDINFSHNDSKQVLDLIVYSGPSSLDHLEHSTFAVATFSMPLRSYGVLQNYANSLKDNPFLVHTGIADGANLALYAAKIIGRSDPAIKKRLKAKFEAGKIKYDNFKDLREV